MTPTEKIFAALEKSRADLNKDCQRFEHKLSEQMGKHNPSQSKLQLHKARVSAMSLQISQAKEQYHRYYQAMMDQQKQAREAENKVDKLKEHVKVHLHQQQSEQLPRQLQDEREDHERQIQQLRQTRDRLEKELRNNQQQSDQAQQECDLYRHCLGLSIRVPRKDDLQIIFHDISGIGHHESITLTMIKSSKDPRKMKRYELRECSVSSLFQFIKDRYLRDLNKRRIHLRDFLAKVRRLIIQHHSSSVMSDADADAAAAKDKLSHPMVSMSDDTVAMMDQS